MVVSLYSHNFSYQEILNLPNLVELMSTYTAITFSPVQGFIEKSRKLRDLFGASLILSHLSKKLVEAAKNCGNTVISPGMITVEKGMPNRILIKGKFSKEQAQEALLSAWKNILETCRKWWIEDNLREFGPYHWEREWKQWENHCWEIFWGEGESITAAMLDLETHKLRRNWTAINWIGESSSITGTDGIAWPGLGAETRNPKYINHKDEKAEIERFYNQLAKKTENCRPDEEPEGKYIAVNEKLSIPELVKRLVTLQEIAKKIGMEYLEEGFQDIIRKPTETTPGQWTGWFMGDGDKVGKHLQELAKEGDQGITNFTDAMREWGEDFYDKFYQETKLGRVIYAGGDDFLGVIYSKNPEKPISPLTAYEWLITLPDKWKEHKQDIKLSVGFVWVAGSVPQRDVLQHCRETEKLSKNLGRNRVTIRVVFNSGQYVQWTCPWEYLHILKRYRDRDGKTYPEWECSGKDAKKKPNWSHVYSDLAQLKSRHAINSSSDDDRLALALFDIYFQDAGHLQKNCEEIVGEKATYQEIIQWICDLINVGWQLCSNI